MSKELAESIMKKVRECLLNSDAVYDSVESMFASIGINQEYLNVLITK